MKLLCRSIVRIANRKLIEPKPFEIAPFEDMFQVTSRNYQFVIGKKPVANVIYEHDCSTPSRVLQKSGIHLFPESMPELNRRQKYAAIVRQLQSMHDNSFRNCKSGKEIFHLDRKIKSEVRRKLYFIGSLDGRKYKHLLKYKPYMEVLAQTTQREYEKNGIEVQALGEKIYPYGKVWMPTNERYLQHYLQIVNAITVTGKADPTFLDIGCGSGVLSFLFAKQFKKSRIVAVDRNPDAVRTSNLNAARLEYRNFEAVEFDLKDQSKFEAKMAQFKMPKTFDWIVVNPPWLISSKMQGESALTDGVYDDSQMLKSSLTLAKRVLSPEGRLVVIYSDLCELLGLCKQSIDSMYSELGWVVVEKQQQLLQEQMVKKSALSEFKSRSKITTYLLKKS